jgi:hypothetical protein
MGSIIWREQEESRKESKEIGKGRVAQLANVAICANVFDERSGRGKRQEGARREREKEPVVVQVACCILAVRLLLTDPLVSHGIPVILYTLSRDNDTASRLYHLDCLFPPEQA